MTDHLVDGRRLRSERTRAAIVEAMLGLVRDGNPRPSAHEIAERAGVTQRTLFNHYSDMAALLASVVSTQVDRVRELFPNPPLSEANLEQRATYIASEFARLNEEIEPVRWSAISAHDSIPAIEAGIASVRALVSDYLSSAFNEELSHARNSSERERIVDELSLAVDPITWRLRRRQYGLSLTQATERLKTSLMALAGSARGETN